MKKKFLTGLVLLAIVTVAGINVKLSLQKVNRNSEVTLKEVEAQANIFENVENGWESKVHACFISQCSYSAFGWTWYGTYEKCVDGTSAAHCWDCKSCDAM